MKAHVLAVLLAVLAGSAMAQDRITKDEQGRIRIVPLPTDAKFLNPWPPEMEDAFWTRADWIIRKNAKAAGYGNTYFENEKSSYPLAMISILGGFRDAGIKYLQGEDANARDWNSHTLGIDYFPCFTLKQQMRKYFYFGDMLDPAYRQRMKDAAKIWTEKDPLGRPHPAFKGPGGGWSPEQKNSWVDTRNTDNLQGMRDCAVYLMAEETGNEATRQLYKSKIAKTVRNMYRVGMGEWDSENYHGHTMTAYIQLYDFAKDPQVKLMGKAAMDYLCATGAFKYWRGGFGGPNKRDYNKPIVRAGSAADHLGLYFGQWVGDEGEAVADNVHFITSAYRPPMAVVGLAHKEFARPAEVLVGHPSYNGLRGGGTEPPSYYETMFFGRTYQLGTLASGTGDTDANGFKMLAYNSKRGVDFFVANTTTDPHYIGSPKYSDKAFVDGNNIGQWRNLAIWLNNHGDAPFIFLLPKSAKVEQRGGITFIAMEKTWLAIQPINLAIKGVDAALTEQVNVEVKADKKTGKETKAPLWPDEQIISAKGTGGAVCGFALEIGEDDDFAQFVAKVQSAARLDLSQIARGAATYKSSDGRALKVAHAGRNARVWRDGKEHDYAHHRGQYQPADGGNVPIRLDWGSGKLHVEAGGWTFDATVAEDGTCTFTNQKVK